MTKPTLGSDIAKKKFDAALFKNGKLKHKSFSNDTSGYQALLDWLRQHGAPEAHACLEATGIYGEPVAEHL